jgi:hypothetical protein
MPCPPAFLGFATATLATFATDEGQRQRGECEMAALIPHFFRNSKTCLELAELVGKGKP